MHVGNAALSTARRARVPLLALCAVSLVALASVAYTYARLRRGYFLPRVPPGGCTITGRQSWRMPVPLVLYPGAQVQAITDASPAMGRPASAVLLGTPAPPATVVRYYTRCLRRFGRLRASHLPRLRDARSLGVSTTRGYQTVTVFRGSRKQRNPWEIPLSDEGDETKILIVTTPSSKGDK